MDEGVDAALSVVALRHHSGHVVPAHGLHDVHHGLGLVGVRGHHPGEEVVARVVAELGGRGGVAHLGDLEEEKEEGGGEGGGGEGGKREEEEEEERQSVERWSVAYSRGNISRGLSGGLEVGHTHTHRHT